MASLGTDTHAMAPCAAIRGAGAVDKGGLLPAGLAFVPVTLGTTASFMGFFLQESVFRHKEPLVLVFLAGTQLLCYVAGVVGLDVLSGGDSRTRTARRAGVILCILFPVVLSVRHLHVMQRYPEWAIVIEAPYWVLTIVFAWLAVRGIAAICDGSNHSFLGGWSRVTCWVALPFLTLAGLPWLLMLDGYSGQWLERLLRPVGHIVFDVVLPSTVDAEAATAMFMSTMSTGLACLMTFLLLLWYARGGLPRRRRMWPGRLALILFGKPLRLRRGEEFIVPALWWILFLAVIFAGGAVCGKAYLLGTNVTADEHWRETLTPTVLGAVGVCVILWLAPGAVLAAVLVRNILAGTRHRLFHFLMVLALVIIPIESCLLFTGGFIEGPTRGHPSLAYVRDFAWVSVLAYPPAAALTTFLALRITRALLMTWRAGYTSG